MTRDNPSHPGRSIGYELEYLGMSIAAGARALGVSSRVLGQVVRCERAISPEMALRLEAVIGSTAGCWLRMQAAHDAARVRRENAHVLRGLKRLVEMPDLPGEEEIAEPVEPAKPVKRVAKKRNGRAAGKPRGTARPAKRTARPAKKASGKSAAKMRKAA